MNVEGITILNTIEVMGSTWGFSIVGLIIAILTLFILIGVIFGIIKNEGPEAVLLSLLAVLGVLISLMCFGTANEYFDYYKYQVIIDDSVSLTEFMEKYEILDQEGLIYTVKEKEIIE